MILQQGGLDIASQHGGYMSDVMGTLKLYTMGNRLFKPLKYLTPAHGRKEEGSELRRRGYLINS
jgi:hypothetical protein